MNAPVKIEVPGLALLRVPFRANQISKLPKGNVMLDYVGHAALTDRLLDADPQWDWEPLAFDPRGLPALDEVGGLWIKLTVCGKTRLGYGHAGAKKGGDAVKEIIGDALRNAAMRFGAALDLWHKGDLHLDDEADAKGDGNAAGGQSEGHDQDAHNASSAPGSNPSTMPDAEWARLVGLIEATASDTGAMLKHYAVSSLKHLSQDQYANAIEALNVKLAKAAKAATDAKAKPSFAEEIGDEIPY